MILHSDLLLYESFITMDAARPLHSMMCNGLAAMKEYVVPVLMSIRRKPTALTVPQLLPELTAQNLFYLP